MKLTAHTHLYILVLLFLVCGSVFPAMAQTAGLVDDYEGNYDSIFAGTYSVFADPLGAPASLVSAAQSHSSSHSRFLHESTVGSSDWGMGVAKTLNNDADISAYADGTLEIWLYSASANATRTFDVSLHFYDGTDTYDNKSVYSLNANLEPTLSSCYQQWTLLSIPMETASFYAENAGAFNLSQLTTIEFFIKNNGAGGAGDIVFFDDVRFVESADTVAPTVTFTDPANSVFVTTTPTITGSLSDDDSGIDPSSLTVSIDGVAQSGALVLPGSFSFTPSVALAESVTHTVSVTVADQAGNSQTAETTFSINTALWAEPELLNTGFEYGDGTNVANWTKWGEFSRQSVSNPRSGSYHVETAGNDTTATNHAGFIQILSAEAGQYWQASVYAMAAEQIGADCSARLQLVFMNAASNQVPGGANESAIVLDCSSTVGTYSLLSASGTAPVGTELVKIVLLYTQANDGDGKVYFDDAQISVITDLADPEITFVRPATPDQVFASLKPTLMGLLSDNRGVDADSLVLSIDGVEQTSAMVLPDSFSCTPTTDLAEGIHTVSVQVADMAGNVASTSTTFTVDSSASVSPELLNGGMEYGDGSLPASWGKFGEVYQLSDSPRSGTRYVKLVESYETPYSGAFQTLPAQPGQTWQASAYAQLEDALAVSCTAKVQLVYVDAAGSTVPGGVYQSEELNSSSDAGSYTQLTVQGRAPVGTEGVKIVLLLIHNNVAGSAVNFDDTTLVETTPTGSMLPTNALIDDFSNDAQYRVQENDLGFYTDDDAQMVQDVVSNGALHVTWTSNSYWFTLFDETDAAASLMNNQYLALRCRGHNGNEEFRIKLTEPASPENFSVVITNAPITDTAMHTVNYPLSAFLDLGLNLDWVRTLTLETFGNSTGGLSIDGLALTTCRQADIIDLSVPSLVEPDVPFDVTVTVSDQDGVISNYDGTLTLSLSEGRISPATVSGFEDGSVTVSITVDAPAYTILIATDMLGAHGDAQLSVMAPPSAPQHPLSSISDSGITLTWEPAEGATGYRVYRRDDELNPETGDLVATVSGQSADEYTDSSAADDHPYIYRITAINTYGESEFSGPAMGTRFTQDWTPAPQTHEGLDCLSRVIDGRLLLHTADGDKPFVAGVNVGATVPGYSPGAVNISREEYRRWFSQIAGLGFRLIRIYTLHKPPFYEELRAYNLANPDAPIYLQHGVWLIEEHLFNTTGNLYHPDVMQSFREEIDDVIAAVHGDLVREEMVGRAYGTYTADVSPWLMNYIVGIELEPHSVRDSDELNALQPAYSGTYFQSAPEASPTERWFARMFDYTASNLAARGESVPLAHGNWPTTDPLDHPDEPIDEEDMVGVDVNHVLPTAAWPGGRFANYHIYPYYPDAVRFEDGITNFVFRGRNDNYAGYINKIVQHHAAAGVPVVISEYGVPSSMGNAHYGPMGRDQGGHSEQGQMEIDRELLDILRNVGCSGASVFMWLDEWFKTTWNVQDIHKPTDRRWYWRNPWCNEANFGIVAAEAGREQKVTIDGDDSEWSENDSQVIFSGAGDVQEVRALHDEGYLYLRIKTADSEVWVNDTLSIGFDVLAAGNQGLPGNPGLATDAEYAIMFGPSASEPTAQAYLATWNDLITMEYGVDTDPPYFPVDPSAIVEGSGSWTQQLLIVSRRLTNTLHQIMPEYYNVGAMRFGTTDPQDPDFDQRTTWSAAGNIIEVRVPYSQIGYGDPSSHQACRVQTDGTVELVDAPDVGISVVYDGQEFATAGYQWDAWNQVEWHERLKADIEVFAQAVVDVNRNYDPVINSSPATAVQAGDTYTYEVSASDANELEMLSYGLLQAPAGMTINEETGVVSWDTTSTDPGEYTVEVEVADYLGATDTQLFTVETTVLANGGFESGSGYSIDGWIGFGERSYSTVDPRQGVGHIALTGNNPAGATRNYTGVHQTQAAEPGQTWRASAYARVAEQLGAGCEALIQLIYVDASGVGVSGGTFESEIRFDENTSVGDYIEMDVHGYAPAGTEGVKMVLLFIQENNGSGIVYFDDAKLEEVITMGIPLVTDAIIDDFDDAAQYQSYMNDLGGYVDDEDSLETETVADGLLTAGWTDGGYWYTLLGTAEPYPSLENNQYLVLRYRAYNGTESFTAKLKESSGNWAAVTVSASDTQMHTVNCPLSGFDADGLNLYSVKSLVLEFPWDVPGTIDIDGIAVASCPQPDQITVTAPEVVNPNEAFDIVIMVSDQNGVLTNFDGVLNLAVSEGSVSPATVSGFVDGVLTTQVTVADAMLPTLYVTDVVGTEGSVDLEVATAPSSPQFVLSSLASGGIEISWDAVAGATGYRVYRRSDELDPGTGDLLATVSGQASESYTDTSSDTEHPYFYRVTAYNSYGESELSEPAIGTRYTRDWSPAPQTVEGLSCVSRVDNGRVWLYTDQGSVPFVAGVNIGATTPGHSPGELNISREQYQRWFSEIAGLGFRAIRIYTLHPPEFYQELRAYNLANPDAPIYLQHGVWLIEEERFVATGNLFDSEVVDSFKSEIEDIVAAVHGDFTRPETPGRADGTFDADVSPWLMCYIVGIEMDPNAILASDTLNASKPAYSGTYFQSSPEASPTERWYAEMFDHAATEIAQRGLSVPLAHGNWPTTDPLDHPDEPIADEDKVGVDVNHVVPTAAWPGGRFANYHAYPYYPDAVRLEDGITNFMYKGHIDNYAGYINKLVQHHAAAGVPVVVSEFGVPSSMGNAHYGPLGRDQGGHSEQAQMQIDRDLLDILRNMGCSGGSVFMWVDEWFKTTWNVQDLHKPNERRWFWRNPWCNEANFGIVAAEAGSEQKVTIDGDDSEWTNNDSQVIFSGVGDVQEVRALHDEGYLYLRIKTADSDVWVNDRLSIGFDVLSAGNQGLPFDSGLATDAEYAIVFGPSPSEPVAQAYLATWNDLISIHYGSVVNPPYFPVNAADLVEGSGSWTQQQLIVSRRLTVPTTGEVIPPEYYNVGDLRFGTTDPQDPDFDQRTAWAADGDVIEVRVPYSQIGYGDPSSHEAYRVQSDSSVITVDAPDVGISIVYDGQEFTTAGYQWDTWNQVDWHQRLKADIEVFAQAVVDVHHNVDPAISTTPEETVAAGDTYTYEVEATDANALEMLTYSLLQAPAGMTVDAESGVVSWETDAADVGEYTVEVQVADGLGATDAQVFTLDVCELDQWDPTDDESTTATALQFMPLMPFETHGPHALSVMDQADWYALEVQQGQIYSVISLNSTGEAKVEIFRDAAATLPVRSDDNTDGGEFSLRFNAAETGTYYARVTAVQLGADVSYEFRFTIGFNMFPNGGLVSPAYGTTLMAPVASLSLVAEATDDGSITQVAFYASSSEGDCPNGAGRILLGVDTEGEDDQYVCEWTDVPAGTHWIWVVLYDDLGFVGSMQLSRAVSVLSTNALLVTPTHGTEYDSGEDILITGTLNHESDNMRFLHFYINGEYVRSRWYNLDDGYHSIDYIEPMNSHTWTNAPDGIHTISVIASDDRHTFEVQTNIQIVVGNAGYPGGGSELAFSINPWTTDSDSDTLYDGEEFETYNTDAANADTDGDLLFDQFELLVVGTDPNDDTDGPQLFADRKRLDGASNHSIVLKSNGTVWCWGRYTEGELGDGRIGDQHYAGGWPPTDQQYSEGLPVQAVIPGNPFIVEISAQHSHSLALDSNGNVFGWGANHWGDLGVGTYGGSTNADARTPFVYSNMPPMKSVSAGYFHNIGLTADGSVWTWGSGWEGQLGAGWLGGGHLPVEVSLDNIVAISAGCRHSMALRGDGSVWAWGWNKYGQIGNNDTNNVCYPTQVTGLSNAVAIKACNYGSMALKADGSVWMWGDNQYGQLGNGTTAGSWTPVQVPGLTNVISIGAGYHTPLALTDDGSVWTWGAGGNGQLGDNAWSNSLSPIAIQGVEALGLTPDLGIEFGGGGWHSLLMDGNGYVYSWGCNHYGQVGYLTPWNTHRTPVTYMGLNIEGANPDTDNDGLLDTEEIQLGTDLADPDSDGDTVNDGEEVTAGTDPLDPTDF